VTTRAPDRLDPMPTPYAVQDSCASLASQPCGGARRSSVVGQPLLAPAAPPPITDPTVVLRITALLGPLAEWGAESSLVAPVGGPPVAARDLVGRALARPRMLSVARGQER
jgi:hypothetical protein